MKLLTYSQTNFNDNTVEAWEWISNFILHMQLLVHAHQSTNTSCILVLISGCVTISTLTHPVCMTNTTLNRCQGIEHTMWSLAITKNSLAVSARNEHLLKAECCHDANFCLFSSDVIAMRIGGEVKWRQSSHHDNFQWPVCMAEQVRSQWERTLYSLRHKVCHHNDVIKWKHFPRYWPFVRGINRSPVNSPHKGQRRGALMFSLICA